MRFGFWTPASCDRDVLIAGREIRNESLRLACKAEILVADEQFFEEQAQRHASDAVADAIVRADAERKVLIRAAADIEPLRVGEYTFVPVGGAEPDDHRVTCRHESVTHNRVPRGITHYMVDRRGPA